MSSVFGEEKLPVLVVLRRGGGPSPAPRWGGLWPLARDTPSEIPLTFCAGGKEADDVRLSCLYAGDTTSGVAGEMGEYPSVIGSKARDSVETEELTVRSGGTLSESFNGCTCTWPSMIDCFRACGWFSGTEAERAKGDDIWGELGAATIQDIHTI